MNLKVSYGKNILFSEFPGKSPVGLRAVLQTVEKSHPEIYQNWCDDNGQLRESLLIFVNAENIRYKKALETELYDGDEVYVIPLIAGG